MNNEPIILDAYFNADIAKVWQAITDKNEMKNWYFDLAAFSPVVGFRFQFLSGPSTEKMYNHLCEVLAVEFEKKLSYSWCYEGYAGMSVVTFELTANENKTHLHFTHSGLANFPKENPDFAVENFVAGWNHIMHKSLKEFVEKEPA
jgi:uncharacterized protein YndB with AHSA1/START domain